MVVITSLLTAAAGGALSKVTQLATDQLSLDIVFGLGKELDKLRDCSAFIGLIIHDTALDPANSNSLAKTEWMKKLISEACKAEDVIDEFQYEVYRIAIKEPRLNKKILGFFSCKNPLLFRFRMARKIFNINKTLNDLQNAAASVGLVRSNGAAGASQGNQDRETTSLLETNEVTLKDAIIVPRTEVSDIIANLSNPTNQERILLVMAIVGLGGLGKTTLARSVTKKLEEGEMKSYFDMKLWVYVSDTFDVNSILRRMLESCEATTSNLLSREALIQSLCQKLEGKKYFLVLDDVWNEEANRWKDLKNCLLQLKSAKGSTVIITTRKASVASIMEADHCCDLEALSIDQCWLIMKDRAFADPNDPSALDFKEIGKELAEKCAGLPLAAKVLGSMLHSKTKKHEWESILANEIWQSSPDNDDNRIMSVLMLSFDNLRPPVKRCFAYCSMLKRGSFIEKDKLIQLWMAQGLLLCSPRQGTQMMEKEMEDIGDEYFDTLLKNSLFQDATKDKDGFITVCKIHDLVHGLAIKVSSSLQDSWTPDFKEKINHSEIRHVARIPTPELESLEEESIARLLSLFSNVHDTNIIFPKLRALRVLSLYEAESQEKSRDVLVFSSDEANKPQQLPISLDKLKHLRYLDLSPASITALSGSIGNLYNLQTLRLPYLLYKCPKEIQNLINLRHLHAAEIMKFEAGLGRLTELRTLTSFNVGKEKGPTIEELGALKYLRGNLVISELEHVRDREQAKSAHLVQKSHVCQLTFRWTYNAPPNENQTEVLDGLEPHCQLRRLRIENFTGARFPSWISTSLGNLSKIVLLNCNNCQELPKLGHLPGLKSLLIDEMQKLERIGAEFYGTGITLFPALKTLRISRCEKLIEWIEAPRMISSGEVEAFPLLEELDLGTGCRKLESAPSLFPCLKKLWICGMGITMALGSISTQLTTLTYLNIYRVEGLTRLPQGILQKYKNLTFLQILYCGELTCIAPDVFGCCSSLRSLIVTQCEKLRRLPDGLHTLPCLDKLEISGCDSLESIRIPHGIASLRELKLSRCEGLSSLEFGLDYCTSLEQLDIRFCPKLVSIPIALGMPSLWTLKIQHCDKLSNLGSGINYCPSLEELVINNCDDLKSIPITEGIASLRRLSIVSCDGLLSLPGGLQYCTSLASLEIRHCSSLVSLSGFHLLTCLKELEIGRLHEELNAFPDFRLPSKSQLESLSLEGWRKLKSLPQQIQYYTCLKNLCIYKFEGLRVLPDWLGNLASLEDLSIERCNNLRYLPRLNAMKSLTKLKQLIIKKCPLLKERCTKQNCGLEWPKISHIPNIRIYD